MLDSNSELHVDAVSDSSKDFHIAFGVDDKYIFPMSVTVISIIVNNPTINLVFHVFASDISEDNQQRLHILETMYRKPIHIHVIDRSFVDQFSDIPLPAHISPAAFTRLLIPAALVKQTDRVLYLDADILCVGDIAGLLSMDISNDIVAVVDDVEDKTVKAQVEKFDLANHKYFNSGVLFINIDRWIVNDISRLTMKTILESKIKLDFADQDALNIILDGRTRFIEKKWNFQYRLFDQLRMGNAVMDLPGDTVFVHFIGVMKPWREWNPHESKALFAKYQALSAWSDVCLDKEIHYKEMHNLSRFLLKRRRVLDSLVWFSRYLAKKYL